jgi:hypothetical protein
MQAIEARVTACPGQQLLVGAAFDDAAFLHHKDPIGNAQG